MLRIELHWHPLTMIIAPLALTSSVLREVARVISDRTH